MDKYIKQLLELNNKIILPTFGAIVISDEESGELMFNEYLTYDDGKLAVLLEEESNLDLQEAKNSVFKFVQELRMKLDKGETYSIFQLGEFSKNEDDEYIFSGNLKSGLVKDSQSTSKESKEDGSKEIEGKESTKKLKHDEPVSDASNLSEDDENKVTPPESETEEDVKLAEETVVEVEENQSNEIEHKVEERLTAKRKRSPVFWILLVLIFILLGGGGFVGLNYEKVEEYMGWNKFDDIERTSSEENISDKDKQNESELSDLKMDEEVGSVGKETEVKTVEDDMVENNTDENIVDENIPEENVVTQPKVTKQVEEPSPKVVANTSKGSYYIIVGTFQEVENAEKLVSDLKQQGFDAEIIGKFNGMHYVSTQSFSTFNEANKNIPKVLNVNKNAWVFKK